jgi:hypothetical protein
MRFSLDVMRPDLPNVSTVGVSLDATPHLDMGLMNDKLTNHIHFPKIKGAKGIGG